MFPMQTISNKGMDAFIGNAEIRASWIGTEVTLGGDGLPFAALAFELIPGDGRSVRARRQNGFTLGKSCLAAGAILLGFGFVDLRFGGRS